MDLKKLVNENREELKVWTEFDGIPLELIYKNRRELDQMLTSSKTRTWKNHLQVEDYDDEAFLEKLSGCINDWKLTLGRLVSLTNITLNGDDPEQIIPCTDENKKVVVGEVYGLNNFIRETIMDIQAFRSKQLEADL